MESGLAAELSRNCERPTRLPCVKRGATRGAGRKGSGADGLHPDGATRAAIDVAAGLRCRAADPGQAGRWDRNRGTIEAPPRTSDEGSRTAPLASMWLAPAAIETLSLASRRQF